MASLAALLALTAACSAGGSVGEDAFTSRASDVCLAFSTTFASHDLIASAGLQLATERNRALPYEDVDLGGPAVLCEVGVSRNGQQTSIARATLTATQPSAFRQYCPDARPLEQLVGQTDGRGSVVVTSAALEELKAQVGSDVIICGARSLIGSAEGTWIASYNAGNNEPLRAELLNTNYVALIVSWLTQADFGGL